MKKLFCILMIVIAAVSASGAESFRFVTPKGDVVNVVVDGAALTVETPPEQPPVTPTPPPSSVARAPVGFNLDRPWESARDCIFTNMRYLSRFTSGALGSDGWPAGDFNLRVISNWEAANEGTGVSYPKDTGEYLFQARGRGTVYAGGATVKSQSYDVATGITTAIISRTDSTQDMDIGMRATAGPVTNINIWRPGYHNSTKMFTDEVLYAMSRGIAARLMNSMETNVDNRLLDARLQWTKADGILQWAERPKETDPFYTGPFGIPLEVLLKLCISANVRPYINFSNYTDEDYWRGAAKACRTIVPTALPIYLAFSNEVWQDESRPDFYQGVQVRAMAANYPIIQDPRYGSANPYYAGLRVQYLMGTRISDTFRAEYGDAAMGSTIRVVFEGHNGDPARGADTLAWGNAVFPKPPSYYFKMYMTAPYYGSGSIASTGTEQQIIDGIYAGQASKITLNVSDMWSNWEMRSYSTARTYNLDWGCYENGLDIGGSSNRANKFKVMRNPQSKGYTIANVAICLAQGCELYMQYKMTSAYGAYTFGATDDIKVLTNPRFEALAEAAATDPRRFELSMFDRITGYYGVAPTSAVLGNGTGLRGTYGYTQGGVAKTLVRTDPVINMWFLNYDTGNAVPRTDVLDNSHRPWSCVWEGQFVPEYTGEHKFSFEGRWAALSFAINSQPVTTTSLTAGVPVPVKIDYRSLDKEGKVRFLVTTPDARKRLVKRSQLIPLN